MTSRPRDLVVTPMGLRMGRDTLPCTIGRNGISAHKQEGDQKTPSGEHRIVGMLYRPDRIAKPRDWAVPIGAFDLWSDDPNDPDYNMMVRVPYNASHEKLRRADPMYDLVLLTDWNWPYAVKNRGSAIFIHQWRRPGYPTAGCIAVSRENLMRIAQFISFGSKLIVPNNRARRK